MMRLVELLAEHGDALPLGRPHRRARLLTSASCRRPIVYGLWQPKIMLPSELCRLQKQPQLRHVLLHESAHVHRGDAWGHLLFCLAFPLLYFHPLYWWFSRRVQFDRELIADDWAARFGNKQSYVEELVGLVRTAPRLLSGSMGVLDVFRFRTQFYRRMKMLIDREQSLATSPSTGSSRVIRSAKSSVWIDYGPRHSSTSPITHRRISSAAARSSRRAPPAGRWNR